MQLVIADTGPVNYLVPIGHIDLLPRLFQRVILPTAVKEELGFRRRVGIYPFRDRDAA